MEAVLQRLSPEIQERHRAARRKDKILQSVFAEMLLRLALAELEGPGRVVRLVRPPEGRPHLADGRFHFSLTHCGTMAACALDTAEVGLDLERIRPEPGGLAARFFTADENAVLDSLPASERDRAFFSLWTAKESYLKLTGQGLAGGLRQVPVSLAPGGPRLTLPGGDVVLLKPYFPDDRHILTACSRRGGFPDSVRAWDTSSAIDTFLSLPA